MPSRRALVLTSCLALALAACPTPEPRRERRRPDDGPGGGTTPGPAAPRPTREVTIRLRDSGIEPDDAFRVIVDGAHLGDTPIGGARTFVVSLATGTHHLAVTGTGAPDGQGTYELEVLGPVELRAGPGRSGVGLNQGVTFRWELVVR